MRRVVAGISVAAGAWTWAGVAGGHDNDGILYWNFGRLTD